MPEIGPLPSARRKLAGIALRVMARWCRVSHPHLLDLERGYRRLRPEVLARYETGLRKLPRKQPNARPTPCTK